jgi:antitoxin VapB
MAAMGLNIKNAETERRIKELADLTGESLTGAIDTAVKEKLARERRKGLADRLMVLGKESAAIIAKSPGKMMTVEDLYDSKTGLPK